jgi:hypothetical protein
MLFPVPLLAPLPLPRPVHGRYPETAHPTTIRRFRSARYSHNVRHPDRPFSVLRAPSLSVGRFQNMTCIFSMSLNVIIFMVNFHPLPSAHAGAPLWGFHFGENR